MTYAKLINSELVIAPSSITIGRTHYNPTPLSYLVDNGYKPIRYTDAPSDERFNAVSHWREDEDEIVQEWELVEKDENEEISDEEALAILFGGESA